MTGNESGVSSWETMLYGGNIVSAFGYPAMFFENGTFYLYYGTVFPDNNRGPIGLATFTWNNNTNNIENFARNANNPIINLSEDSIFKSGVGHMDASYYNGTYYMYIVRQLLGTTTHEVALLTSTDKINWNDNGKMIQSGNSGEWTDTHTYRGSLLTSGIGEVVILSGNVTFYYSAYNTTGIPNIGFASGNTIINYNHTMALNNSGANSYAIKILTDLNNSQYTYWVECNDSTNNLNQTETRILTIDTFYPAVTLGNITVNRTIGEVIINQSEPVITGENLTFRFNVTDTNVFNVWLTIWEGIKYTSNILWNGFLALVGGLWQVTVPINLTYHEGLLNYTLYANDSAGLITQYQGNFSISYNTTGLYQVLVNNTINSTIEYGQNFTAYAYYNLTNGTIIQNSVCNMTLDSIVSNLSWNSSGDRYENTTLNTLNYNIGTSKNITFSCYKINYVNNTGIVNITIQDTVFPSAYLYSSNKTPITSYNSDNVTLNASISDLLLQEIWVEGNWTGSWANYTNRSGALFFNNGEYSYNISYGNFSNQEVAWYKWCANDTSNNINCTGYNLFKIENRGPDVAIWRYPTMDMHMLYDNFTIFDWDNSSDDDLDSLSYDLEIYNNTAFNSTYFVFAINLSMSNYTLPASSMPPAGNYYLRYRTNDSIGYTSYNYSNFSVVYATLNIVAPSQNQILRKQNIYWFNVTELGNGDWASNVSLELRGATFTNYINLTNKSAQFAYTSYGANVTIPDVASQYVILYAYSWNGSIGSSTNNTDEATFRITIPNVVSTTTPIVNYFCPDKTYNIAEQINITVRSTMESVLVDTVNVSVVTPGGSTIILNQTANDGNDYIGNDYGFENNFTYTPSSEGEYQLKVEVKDVNSPENGVMTNSTSYFIVSNRTNITFTSNGISNFTVLDLCSNEAIINSNASLTMNEVPGYYNLQFVQDKLTTLVSNVSLDGDEGEICTYYDLAETITPPTNKRAIDQFNLSCYNLNYGWSNTSVDAVNMTYNYTNAMGSITHEENLGAYKCYSTASCSWAGLSSTVTSDINRIKFATNNFSVFMVSEDVTVTTVTVTTPGSSGGGGGSGGGGSKSFYDLDILKAGALTIGNEAEVSTIVTVSNTGQEILYGISLSANSQEQGLNFSFDKNYIFELAPGKQELVTLKINKVGPVKEGKFDVNIIADVVSPSFIDTTKLAITLLGENPAQAQARKQIEFLDRLFIQNPACKELYELVKKAKESFGKGDYENSLKLSEGAVNACESLLSSLGLKVQKPKTMIFTENVILGIEIGAFIMIFYGIYYYYKRRRFKNKNI